MESDLQKFYALPPHKRRRLLAARKKAALPPAFITHWQTLCRTYPTIKEAHRQLIITWRACRLGLRPIGIPGYTTPPPPAETSSPGGNAVPAGWTYRHLMRFAR